MVTLAGVNALRWSLTLTTVFCAFQVSLAVQCFSVCDCHARVARCNLSASTQTPTFYYTGLVTAIEIVGHPQITQLSPSMFEAPWTVYALTIENTNVSSLECTLLDGIAAYLSTLRLKGHGLREIPPCAFIKLSRLQHLAINNCPINSLEDGAFDSVRRLITLDLAENFISEINIKTFKTMTSLKRLSFRGNRLRTLKSQQFKDLGTPPLEMLDLSYNQIETIPSDSFDGIGPKLYGLDLSHNRITQTSWQAIVEAFPSCPNLATLTASGNPLQEIDSSRLKSYFGGLTTLNLANCSLPSSVWKDFKHIRSLDISANGIRLGDVVVESRDRKCPSEESKDGPDTPCPDSSLDISGNTVQSLEVRVDNLETENTIVTADNCNIGQVSLRVAQNTTFNDTTVFLSLSIARNEIQSPVPVYINQTGEPSRNLSLNLRLSLRDNKLQTGLDSVINVQVSRKNGSYDKVNVCEFTNRSIEISELDLSGNGLTSIPKASCLLREVAVLKLNRNSIRRIGNLFLDGRAIGFNRTRVIEIRENGLNSVDALAFDGLPNLEVLDLQDNSIATLARMAFLQRLKSFKRLALDNNPMHCDCSVGWFADYSSLFPTIDFRDIKITGRCSPSGDREGFNLLCFSLGNDKCSRSATAGSTWRFFGQACEGDRHSIIKDFGLSADNSDIVHVVWRSVGPALVSGFRISYQSASTPRAERFSPSPASNTTLSLRGGETYTVCITTVISAPAWKSQNEYCGRIKTDSQLPTTVIVLGLLLALVGIGIIVTCVLYCRVLRRKAVQPGVSETYSHAKPMTGAEGGNNGEKEFYETVD